MSVATVPPRVSYPVTTDSRYFVVRGRLWRTNSPALDEVTRAELVSALMAARRAVRDAKGDQELFTAARAAVNIAKCALGERVPVWWIDGTPDYNCKMVAKTPYAAWYAGVLREQVGAD